MSKFHPHWLIPKDYEKKESLNHTRFMEEIQQINQCNTVWEHEKFGTQSGKIMYWSIRQIHALFLK